MVKNMKKKVFCVVLSITLLMTFEPFAAIVSDNDGSAFVTKAEFDALKNSFNSQISSYNESIDNKIDGAIASYLAGIKLADVLTEPIIFSDWNDVTCMNGVIAPEFCLPNSIFNIFYAVSYFSIGTGTEYRNNGKMMAGTFRLQYPKTTKVWATTETNKRALVTGNSEAASDQQVGMIWNGVALRYDESYTVSRTFQTHNDIAYLDVPSTYKFGVGLKDPCALLMNSYLANYKTETTAVINPTVVWKYGTSSPTSTVNLTFSGDSQIKVKTNTAEVALLEKDGKTKDYEHIVQWDKSSKWCVSNETFTRTFRQHSSNSKTSKTLFNDSNTNKTANMDCFGMIMGKDAAHTAKSYSDTYGEGWMYFNSSVTYEDAANKILPSIGMLKNDANAYDIKQHNTSKRIVFNKKNFDIAPLTLEKGFQLLAATEDAKITWAPMFSEYYYWNGSSYITTATPINVMFSIGPFTDKDTPTEVIKMSVGGVEKDYITINSGERISFTMPQDGIVYVKWWPNIDSTYISGKDWRVKIDLNNSKTFNYSLPQ